MFVQRKIKVMLDITRLIFLTESPQVIHWPNISLSGTYPCENSNWDDVCFSVAIVLLANVTFMPPSYISGL